MVWKQRGCCELVCLTSHLTHKENVSFYEMDIGLGIASTPCMNETFFGYTYIIPAFFAHSKISIWYHYHLHHGKGALIWRKELTILSAG